MKVRKELFAHADTAILTATRSPFSSRYSVVVIAGLQAAATERAMGWVLDRGASGSEVVILRTGKPARSLVVTL